MENEKNLNCDNNYFISPKTSDSGCNVFQISRIDTQDNSKYLKNQSREFNSSRSDIVNVSCKINSTNNLQNSGFLASDNNSSFEKHQINNNKRFSEEINFTKSGFSYQTQIDQDTVNILNDREIVFS